MAFLMFCLLIVLSGAALILRGLLQDEVKAWLPILSGRLINAASRRVHPDKRAQYHEEWSAHINEVPGQLSKLYVAYSILRKSRTINQPTLMQQLEYGRKQAKRLERNYYWICAFLIALPSNMEFPEALFLVFFLISFAAIIEYIDRKYLRMILHVKNHKDFCG